jgi:hypothetical protein
LILLLLLIIMSFLKFMHKYSGNFDKAFLYCKYNLHVSHFLFSLWKFFHVCKQISIFIFSVISKIGIVGSNIIPLSRFSS